jgi:preprotein translocase subunit SecA
MNDQRKVIYEQRNEIMSNQDLDENVKEITHDVNSEIINSNIPLRTFKEEWNIDNLSDKISEIYFTDFNIKEFIEKEDEPDNHKLIDFLNHNVAKLLSEKQQELGENIFSNAQQKILLFTIDHLWKEHLFAMDHLRHGIHLRAYGQKDPLNEYKKEAFELFTHMLSNLKELYIKRICNMRIDNSKEELPKEPSRNGTCPCGSNKKFKHCHGRLES